MIKALGVVAGAVVAALVGGTAILWRAAHPAFAAQHVADSFLDIDMPAARAKPEFHEERGVKGWFFAVARYDKNKQPPFNTRWDSGQAHFGIREWPAEMVGDPKASLTGDWQRETGRRSEQPPASALRPVQIGGLSGWRVTMPAHEDILDIGPFKQSLYGRFLDCDPAQDRILLPHGPGRVIDIAYQLPGDKIARSRYGKIFGGMLASLKFK